MNIQDYFAGNTSMGSSGGLASSFILLPELPRPGGVVAPAIVTSYEISQNPTGNAVVLLFYDATTAPADATPLFGNADPTPNCLWRTALAPGTAFNREGIHGYRKGLVIIASTSWTAVQRSNAQVLFTVHYFPYHVS